MRIPIKIPKDPSETIGLRSARDFDPEQAQDWLLAAQTGRDIGYEDHHVVEIIAAFAVAILRQESVYLSRETELRISRFMADPRIVAVGTGFAPPAL